MMRFTAILLAMFLGANAICENESKPPTGDVPDFARNADLRNDSVPLSQRLPESVSRHLPDNVKSFIDCRRNLVLLGIGLAAPVVLGGATWLYYNWGKRDGEWNNRGTEEMPSWVPNLGTEFDVTERVTRLNIPRERTMWVDNGKNSFGKVTFKGDRIQYVHGNELVAETEIVSPYGRPFDANKPIRVPIKDGWGNAIGSVHEVSEETSPGVHSVRFRIFDSQNRLVGQTDAFEETNGSRPVSKKWSLPLKDGDQETATLDRKGNWVKGYHWKINSGESPMDPRLLIILSSYKSYVESFRQ